jgi:hypothetical protein
MKKLFLLIGLLMAFLMAGCSAAQVDSQDPSQGEAGTAAKTDEYSSEPQGIQNAAEISRLLFGTLMLEGTDNSVTPEQASELLSLWKLYGSLLDSDITATEEIEAVAKRLSQTMTPEQLAAMESQDFDRDQMNAIMEELGIDPFGGAGRGEGFEPPDGFVPPDGFQPGQGGGPGGGGRPGGGDEIDPEVLAMRQAEREAGGGFQRGFNLPLVEALIELLEERAG